MENEIIEVGSQRWLVRQAKSRHEALAAVTDARVTGSVGAKTILNETFVGGGMTVLADVVQINSDGTERRPYTEPY